MMLHFCFSVFWKRERILNWPTDSSLSDITNLHNITNQHLDSAWQAESVAAQQNSKSWPGGTASDPAAAEKH
jgi:hypothetical protein